MFWKLRNRSWGNQNSAEQTPALRRNSHSGRNGLTKETYDALETRCLLAFSGFFDGTTLTLTQTVDDGAVVIDNNGAADAFQATDGSGLVAYVAATNLVVNMLDSTGNQLDLDLDNVHVGNVELNLGEGTRAVNFTGTTNSVGGDLTVNGGSMNQTVEVAVTANFSVGGNASFDLGTGIDIVDEDGNDVAITGNLNLTGVNEFENDGTMSIGGNVTHDVSAETETTRFDDDSALAIGGDFTFTGGDGRDEVLLNDTGATTIGGNVLIDVGDNTVGGTQFVWWNATDTTITGNVTVLSTSSINPDDIQDIAGATVNGNVLINLGGGANDADLLGTIGGSTVEYIGGSGVDDVVYNLSGSLVDVTVTLGDGNDTFVLGPNVTIDPSTLIVDFGDDSDTYTNNFGAFTFNAQLLGLQGFDYDYDFGSSTLVATEVSGTGPFEFDTNGTGGAVRFNNSLSITPADNLAVNMLNDSGNQLDIDLDTALAGNLVINLGDGARPLNFVSGVGNTINGNLTVTGGAGAQTVEVAVNTGLTVGGSATFSLGQGLDTVDEDNNNISIGTDFILIGVNKFENGGVMTVGGNMSSDTTAESIAADIDNDNSLTINGNFTFLGGGGEDFVQLNSTSSVLGNVFVSLGDSSGGGGAGQTFRMNDPGNSVGGTITATAGDNLDGFSDDFLLNATGTFGGNINVSYGAGPNTIQFLGVFGGSTVYYTGGSGTDSITYGMTGAPAFVNLIPGAGDDTFTISAGAAISPTTLRVDFTGGGNDTFVNNFGVLTFNISFVNWDNFNRYYSFATDTWNMVQLVDTGNVTVTNNGPGGAIQLINSLTTTMTDSANVRLNMLPNTGNVAIDFDSPLAGFLVVTAKAGDRNIDFTGSSNTIGGSLFVDADGGNQKVELAVNAPLVVGGHAVINLRTGYDIVDNDLNNVSVTNNLIFRGVNEYENRGTVNVGNLTMNTTFEVEKARLDNDGGLNVAGNFTYIGGQEKDDILLNDGVNVAGNTYISLGENVSGIAAQNVNLTGGFQSGGFVSVLGGQSFAGNSVVTDTSTTIGQSFIIDFSANSSGNFAVIDGTYGGNFGMFKGGSGNDVVTMDEVAGDMDFFMQLGAGEDTLNLGDGTSLNYLFVSFGDGIDTFNDEFFGNYPFATAFWQLP